MRWQALGFASLCSALFVAFYFFPGSWCEPRQVKFLGGAFVVVTGALYLWFVDDERRPMAGTLHRILIGTSVGVVVAAIAGGPFELFGLLSICGAVLGYIGFRWLKHVPL
jgi:hypothetical protein